MQKRGCSSPQCWRAAGAASRELRAGPRLHIEDHGRNRCPHALVRRRLVVVVDFSSQAQDIAQHGIMLTVLRLAPSLPKWKHRYGFHWKEVQDATPRYLHDAQDNDAPVAICWVVFAVPNRLFARLLVRACNCFAQNNQIRAPDEENCVQTRIVPTNHHNVAFCMCSRFVVAGGASVRGAIAASPSDAWGAASSVVEHIAFCTRACHDIDRVK